MIINYINHEPNNWHVERINADKVEFSYLHGRYLIVNEGEMLLSLDDVISITDKVKSRKG